MKKVYIFSLAIFLSIGILIILLIIQLNDSTDKKNKYSIPYTNIYTDYNKFVNDLKSFQDKKLEEEYMLFSIKSEEYELEYLIDGMSMCEKYDHSNGLCESLQNRKYYCKIKITDDSYCLLEYGITDMFSLKYSYAEETISEHIFSMKNATNKCYLLNAENTALALLSFDNMKKEDITNYKDNILDLILKSIKKIPSGPNGPYTNIYTDYNKFVNDSKSFQDKKLEEEYMLFSIKSEEYELEYLIDGMSMCDKYDHSSGLCESLQNRKYYCKIKITDDSYCLLEYGITDMFSLKYSYAEETISEHIFSMKNATNKCYLLNAENTALALLSFDNMKKEDITNYKDNILDLILKSIKKIPSGN